MKVQNTCLFLPLSLINTSMASRQLYDIDLPIDLVEENLMKFATLLKMPIYVAQLATGAKSFVANPILGSKRLNRWGLHTKRVKLAMDMANWRRKKLARHITPEQEVEYQKNGFIKIENFLPQSVFELAIEELAKADFERFDMFQGSTITRRATIDEIDLRDRPGLAAAKGDERLRHLIRYVASHGGEPLLTLQVVMALPNAKTKNGAIDPQTSIHSDTFQPTAKAWLFLQDVGEDDGPFSYVAGSHIVTPQRYAWEKEISENANSIEVKYSARGSLRTTVDNLAALGYPPPTIMTVKANTLIVADTHGFHARCDSPNETTRMEIYGSLRRNPFLPFCGLHIASLPFITRRSNRLMLNGLATLKKLGIRGTPWKEEGVGKLTKWPARLLSQRKPAKKD